MKTEQQEGHEYKHPNIMLISKKETQQTRKGIRSRGLTTAVTFHGILTISLPQNNFSKWVTNNGVFTGSCPIARTISQTAPTCTCWIYLGRISATYSPKAHSCFCSTSFFGLTVAKEKNNVSKIMTGNTESYREKTSNSL